MVDDRAAVRQAAESVNARTASLSVARSERWPSVSFNSSYGRVAYPSSVPSFGDFLTNWTVGAFAQVPLFTGGRLRGDRMAAEAAGSAAKPTSGSGEAAPPSLSRPMPGASGCWGPSSMSACAAALWRWLCSTAALR